MIGIFHTPKLLVTTVEKVAIERELLAMGDFFGGDKWREAGLHLPETYLAELSPDPESITRLFISLCNELELDTERIQIFFSNEEVDSVSGLLLVHTDVESLDENGNLKPDFQSDILVGTNLRFESLLGELIRILVAEKLIVSAFVDASYEDLWLCAEVATVFFGFGLFTINETVSCCQTTSTGTAYFSIVKLGALNSFGIGYLLALVLWYRNQSNLKISRYLRPDAEHSFQKSLEYLEKTNDSLLVDPNLTRLDSGSSISALEAQMKTSSPTGIIWILELIQFKTELAREVTLIKPTLFMLLSHSDIHISQLALHLISFCESFDSVEIRKLQKIALSNDSWSCGVASNILSMHLPFQKCETEFSRLVERFDHAAAANAAQMANRFGKEAAKYTEPVCNRIRIALNRCDYELGRWYTLILLGICENVREKLGQVFGDDEELLRGSLSLLDESIDVTEINYGEKESRPNEINDIFSIPAWVSI